MTRLPEDVQWTRVVAVSPAVEVARTVSEDRCTRVASLGRGWRPRLGDARSTFERHREELTELANEQVIAGFLAVVVSARGVVGSVWNKAGPRPRVATIGRHSCCDLTVPGDEEVSLRHLVLLVRGEEGQPARGRVFDLASTNAALEGEEGVKSVELGDLAAVFIPGHWVFFIRTREGGISLSAEASFIDTAVPVVAHAKHRGGVLDFGGEVAERLSGAQLAEGVLLGRYHRCLHDTFDSTLSVSRVHAVLVEDRGDTLIFDAGSTNGVVVNGDECRARILAAGDEVRLGRVTFEWRPAHIVVAARPLFPSGVEDVLRGLTESGLPVFADWLLSRGSRWGEWIAAELQRPEVRAPAFEEELGSLLLGPLGALRERRWAKGVLVSAKLVDEVKFNWAKALNWPLWAGLRDLDTDESTDGDWVRLNQAGALRSLRSTTVWSAAAVRCLGTTPSQLSALRVRGAAAMKALVTVLPSLDRLEKLELTGSLPSVLTAALAQQDVLPSLKFLLRDSRLRLRSQS